ncbi:MAG: fibrobacter succinogenes major paralogous domain-containing protein [Bacteroidales bacterium]
MKRGLLQILISLVSFVILVVFLQSCKKDNNGDTPPIKEPSKPSVETGLATWVRETSVTLSGKVSPGNTETQVSFEYGTTTDYGYVITADPATVSGTERQDVTTEILGLTAGTVYHYRIKAQNSVGDTTGLNASFTTFHPTSFNSALTYGTVTDIDGNNYKTIEIGTQVWMAENLKTETFSDGTAIDLVTDATGWSNLTTPGFAWYGNNSDVYGALYNWHTVNTGKLCPNGWHVPGDGEWSILIEFLGGEAIAGNKLKEAGIAHWLSPNPVTANESGFTALPGGFRNSNGTYSNVRRYGYWWSSTERSASDAWARSVYYGYSNADRSSGSIKSGFSVRCIKDSPGK